MSVDKEYIVIVLLTESWENILRIKCEKSAEKLVKIWIITFPNPTTALYWHRFLYTFACTKTQLSTQLCENLR